MITVVSEQDGLPLGVLKRGKPRCGDTIWIDEKAHDVIDTDRDTVTVRQNVVFPIRQHQYNDNGPVTRLAGHTGRFRRNIGPVDPSGFGAKPGEPFDLPVKKGPIYPPNLGPQYSYPSAPPYQMPYSGPPQTFEQAFPMHQPAIYLVVHYKYNVPLYKYQTVHEPQIGFIDQFGKEKYQFVKVEGRTIFVKPLRNWNYAVVATDKQNGTPLIFVPFTNINEMSDTKYWVNQYLQKQQGIQRKEYHLKYVPFHKITRYVTNKGKGQLVTR